MNTEGLAFPKGQPSCLRKQALKAAEDKAWSECKRHVTKREGWACRLTGKRGRTEHHHILARSLGGRHTPENVVLLNAEVHGWVKQGLLHIEGDAELPMGLRFVIDARVSKSGTEETVWR